MISIKGKLAKIVKIRLFDTFGNEYHLDELAQSYLQDKYCEDNEKTITQSYDRSKLPLEVVLYTNDKYNTREYRFSTPENWSNKIYHKKLYLVVKEGRVRIQDIAPHKERAIKHNNRKSIKYIYFGSNLKIDDLNVTVDLNDIVNPVYDIEIVKEDLTYLKWLRSRSLSRYGYCRLDDYINTLDNEDDLLLYANDEGFKEMTPDDFTVFCMATGRYETYLSGYVEALLYFLNKRLAVDRDVNK